MKISYFRGVLMRNALSIIRPRKFKLAIVDLDEKDGLGTHSVGNKKVDNNVEYFASFGNF